MRIKNNILIINIYNKMKGYRQKVLGDNNLITTANSIIRRSNIEVLGNNNKVSIGQNCRFFNSRIFISGDNHHLIIGDDCIFKNTVIWFEDGNCKILIGKNTTVEGAHIAITEPDSTIKIGEDCMISSGIDIRNGDSHSIIDIENGKRINYARDITIENHVWIGKDVGILKGVTIGQNSIIGVRSLVTKSISKNSIAVGSPAEVVKTNVNWDRRRIYD